MATKITTWTPDTCSCTVNYSWDDSVSESSRVHSFHSVSNKCTAHQSLSDQQCYDVLVEENPRKNNALGNILANGPTALFDTVDGNRQLKGNLIYNFSWTGTAPNRVLNISFTGISLTTQQKTTLQTALNTRFGSGKVLIS